MPFPLKSPFRPTTSSSVDAADYTVWLDNQGNPAGLPNDNNLGTVGQSHYDLWKTNFGMIAGSGSASDASVPEPGCLLLLFIGMGITCLQGRRVR
jgi:hypothetical protein